MTTLAKRRTNYFSPARRRTARPKSSPQFFRTSAMICTAANTVAKIKAARKFPPADIMLTVP
jgi:hypothetical protein